MDRERLKDIQSSDLTESRVNEDFVDWLKKHGPTYLLIILAVIFAVVYWNNRQQGGIRDRDEAFAGLLEVQGDLPQSIEEFASAHDDEFAVGTLGRLQAARTYVNAVRQNRKLIADDAAEPAPLTEEERDQYIKQAKRLFEHIIASDLNGVGASLYAIQARHGLAGVYEATGDFEQARSQYSAAQDQAADFYPGLAEWSKERIATIDELADSASLPDRDSLPEPVTAPEDVTPISIDPVLKPLLDPDRFADS